MFAVIHRGAPPRGAGALPLAGPPLVIRQLQWLRSAGIQRVALEIGPDARGERVTQLVAEHPLLAQHVRWVRSAEPLSPSVLGARAGFGAVPLLALSESVIGSADLAAFYRRGPSGGVRVGRLASPWAEPERRFAEVQFLSPRPGPAEVERLSGWGASVETRGAAHRLACAALLGQLPGTGEAPSLVIHAAERAPGVWVARGGRLHGSAVVQPPVLVGVGARVGAGARLGPGAFIGERALIEPGAVVEQSIVAPDTIVGEGLVLRGLLATPDGLSPLEGDDDAVTPLADPLLLSRRRSFFRGRRRRP